MMHDRERRPVRLGNQRDAVSHVIAGAAVEPHAVAILACDDPKAIVLDLIGTQVKLGVRMEAGQLILYDKNRSLAILVLMHV
jgi:hypothetical protein